MKNIPPNILEACTCLPLTIIDKVSGHATGCPVHQYIMQELFNPNAKEIVMENIPQPPAVAPNINWQVWLTDGGAIKFYCPHCNADAQGLLAVGGPGEVLAVFAPGSWSRIENLDAKGADGVARVRG